MNRPYEEVNLPGREREIELLWRVAVAAIDLRGQSDELDSALDELDKEMELNDRLEDLVAS